MAKIENKIRNNFTIVPNELLLDKKISASAKTVYWYMASKPDDWKFFATLIASDLGMGVDTVRKYITTLVEGGWLFKGEQQNDGGVFGNVEYVLLQEKNGSPLGVNTDTVKSRHGNYRGRKIPQHNNTVLNNIVEENNTVNIEEWREDYEKYISLVVEAKSELLLDDAHKAKMEDWYNNLDYAKTVEKTADWWASEEAWAYSKKKKKGNINMLLTLKRNLERNRLYLPMFKHDSPYAGSKLTADQGIELLRAARLMDDNQ